MTIYSIGYGVRKFNTFLQLLENYEIDTIVDVRSHPVSRYNPEFSRNSLVNELAAKKISYYFEGARMGGKPKDPLLYINGKLNYPLVQKTDLYKAGIEHLLKLAETRTVCLMCCEANPDQCHRKNLISKSLLQYDIVVDHINDRGFISPHPLSDFIH